MGGGGGGEDGGGAVGRSAHHPEGPGLLAHVGGRPCCNDGMGGKERCQMGFHTNRAHSGATTTMRNAEGFVKVEMRDITAIVSWSAKAHLRIHVCPIKVRLYQEKVDHKELKKGRLNIPVLQHHGQGHKSRLQSTQTHHWCLGR